jgi:hypothetical protein
VLCWGASRKYILAHRLQRRRDHFDKISTFEIKYKDKVSKCVTSLCHKETEIERSTGISFLFVKVRLELASPCFFLLPRYGADPKCRTSFAGGVSMSLGQLTSSLTGLLKCSTFFS